MTAKTYTVFDEGMCFLAPPVMALIDQKKTQKTSKINVPLERSRKMRERKPRAMSHGFAS